MTRRRARTSLSSGRSCYWKISATEEVIQITVFVAVELFEGVLNDVTVFLTKQSANKAEQDWLKKHSIADGVGRECKGQNGTELIVRKCDVRP